MNPGWLELVQDVHEPLKVKKIDLQAGLGDAQILVHLIQASYPKKYIFYLRKSLKKT